MQMSLRSDLIFWGLFGWIPFLWILPIQTFHYGKFANREAQNIGYGGSGLFVFFCVMLIVLLSSPIDEWGWVVAMLVYTFFYISIIGLLGIWVLGFMRLCYFDEEQREDMSDSNMKKMELKSTSMQL